MHQRIVWLAVAAGGGWRGAISMVLCERVAINETAASGRPRNERNAPFRKG